MFAGGWFEDSNTEHFVVTTSNAAALPIVVYTHLVTLSDRTRLWRRLCTLLGWRWVLNILLIIVLVALSPCLTVSFGFACLSRGDHCTSKCTHTAASAHVRACASSSPSVFMQRIPEPEASEPHTRAARCVPGSFCRSPVLRWPRRRRPARRTRFR